MPQNTNTSSGRWSRQRTSGQHVRVLEDNVSFHRKLFLKKHMPVSHFYRKQIDMPVTHLYRKQIELPMILRLVVLLTIIL